MPEDTLDQQPPSTIDKPSDFGEGASGSQRALDEVIANHPALQNVKLTVYPEFDPELPPNVAGRTTRGGRQPTTVRIGPASFISEEELVDTIIHEELHVRAYDSAVTNAQKLPDADIEELRVLDIVSRFRRAQGF